MTCQIQDAALMVSCDIQSKIVLLNSFQICYLTFSVSLPIFCIFLELGGGPFPSSVCVYVCVCVCVCVCVMSINFQVRWLVRCNQYLVNILNPIQTGGGGRLTFKSFITHERLCLQCSYFVTFPQIYLGTIWCC